MGWASKLFGKDKIKQQDTLNPEQAALRDSMIGDIGQHTTGAIDTMGGYAQTAYNPYDELEGDRVVEGLRNTLITDNERNKRAYANTNIGKRFSYARSAGENQMNQDLSNKMTDLDYQNLMQKTGFRQQGYGNQMQALQGVLGTAQGLMNPTMQNMQMHSPGALDYLSGITSGIQGVKGLFKKQ